MIKTDDLWLMHGDCLELMKEIPDGSVDLVLCDPPYGTAGGMGKGEERYSRIANVEWDNAISPQAIFEECNRILRTNGALILFSQEPYTSRLITEAHGNLPFSYRLIWLKDHFANSLLAKKAPVSYFEDICVFFKRCPKWDFDGENPLRYYAAKIMSHIGKNLKQINSDLGHRRAEHFFYVKSTQFSLCTEKTYNQILDFYGLRELEWLMSYDEMREINEKAVKANMEKILNNGEKVFNLHEGKKYKSNVLQYKKDYTGHHPTQKPVALLEDLIKTYTNEGSTVLDFTMGSGSTGVACMNTGRRFIGIEKDDGYFEIAKKRILG